LLNHSRHVAGGAAVASTGLRASALSNGNRPPASSRRLRTPAGPGLVPRHGQLQYVRRSAPRGENRIARPSGTSAASTGNYPWAPSWGLLRALYRYEPLCRFIVGSPLLSRGTLTISDVPTAYPADGRPVTSAGVGLSLSITPTTSAPPTPVPAAVPPPYGSGSRTVLTLDGRAGVLSSSCAYAAPLHMLTPGPWWRTRTTYDRIKRQFSFAPTSP